MIEELLVVFFFVLLFGFVLWALIGLIHMPVFSKDMVSFLFAADEEKLEAQVRAYGWLREEKKNSARRSCDHFALTLFQEKILVRFIFE